jgi:fructose-1,6-bisphosphatase class II
LARANATKRRCSTSAKRSAGHVGVQRRRYPAIDIAVDPLEGTNLCAFGENNAIAVLAASDAGGLLHAPDIYMEKLVVGPTVKHAVFLDAPVSHNLKGIAKALGRRIEEVVVVVLDRPRHEDLIAEIRETGARIKLIRDGDLSAGIAAAVAGTGVHAVMGIGGAPEGVLTAAAMKCLNGEIFARLVISKPEHEERCKAMGISNPKRIFTSADLAPSENIIFAATGVTDGENMHGVRFFGDGVRTSSIVIQTNPHHIRFIGTIHAIDQRRRIRFNTHTACARALAPESVRDYRRRSSASSFNGDAFLPLRSGARAVGCRGRTMWSGLSLGVIPP